MRGMGFAKTYENEIMTPFIYFITIFGLKKIDGRYMNGVYENGSAGRSLFADFCFLKCGARTREIRKRDAVKNLRCLDFNFGKIAVKR